MDTEQPEPTAARRSRTNYSARLGYDDYSLTELVEAIRHDDDGWAWQALVERLSRTVSGALSSFNVDSHLRNDAAAETWQALFEHLDRIRDTERLGGWVGVVAANNMRRLLGRRNRSIPFGEIERLAEMDGVEDEDRLVTDEVRAALGRAVDRLSSREQAIVRGRAYTADPEPLASMEHRLDIPAGSIGPTLGRCVRKLRNDPELVELFPAVRLHNESSTTAKAGVA